MQVYKSSIIDYILLLLFSLIRPVRRYGEPQKGFFCWLVQVLFSALFAAGRQAGRQAERGPQWQ